MTCIYIQYKKLVATKEKTTNSYTYIIYIYCTVGPSHRYIVNNSREVQSQTYSLPTSTLELVVVYLPVAGVLVL